MSYAVPVPRPPKQRPAVVTVSSLLLYFSAVLLVANVAVLIVAFKNVGTLPISTSANGRQITPEEISSILNIVVIVLGVIYGLIAATFVTLGILNSKGKNPSRIVTWSFGGLAALCCGCNQISSLASGPLSAVSDVNGTGTQVQQPDLPAGVTTANLATTGLMVLCLIVALILLMLPTANDFFRKEQEVWVPPTWPGGPGYPGTVGYPTVPGYPTAPGYPAAPGYPTGYPTAPGYPAPEYPAPGTPGDSPSGPGDLPPAPPLN